MLFEQFHYRTNLMDHNVEFSSLRSIKEEEAPTNLRLVRSGRVDSCLLATFCFDILNNFTTINAT